MMTAPYPHCDSRILHAPGECKYCDKFPEAQKARVDGRVNFTGKRTPGFEICPSEQARPIEVSHRWGGNRPVKPDPADKSGV